LGIGTCLPVSNEKGGELSAMLNIKIQQQEELAASLQLKLHKLKVILNSLRLSGISVRIDLINHPGKPWKQKIII
jgi:hypothetical protein